MRIYQCDACGKAITDPYEARMKEFYVGYSFDHGGVYPENTKIKTKVHLCEECYKGLHKIAQRMEASK